MGQPDADLQSNDARSAARAGSRPSPLDLRRSHRRKENLINSKLFVGNLNFQTTSDQIKEVFSGSGEVLEVILPTDRNTGRPRGFAFVEYATEEQAKEAVEKFNGYQLDGRDLRVNEAEKRPPRRPTWSDNGPSFGGGGGGGGHRPSTPPARPKGSRRNLRGKKRSL